MDGSTELEGVLLGCPVSVGTGDDEGPSDGISDGSVALDGCADNVGGLGPALGLTEGLVSDGAALGLTEGREESDGAPLGRSVTVVGITLVRTLGIALLVGTALGSTLTVGRLVIVGSTVMAPVGSADIVGAALTDG